MARRAKPVYQCAMSEIIPGGFGVYVHWPFCASKCPYCDFNSHVRHQKVDEARFLAALRRELATQAAWQPGARVDTVFLGGGTPSLMAPETVAGVLSAIRENWPVSDAVEVTLEANPSSVEAGRFRGYADAGVNRVSLGVQALADVDLKALGRLHTAKEARAAIDIATATFPRVSFDLIYARPGQSADDWRRELLEALAIGTSHLSLYQLTIEDGTPFAALHKAGKLVPPEPELAAELLVLTEELTAVAGLPLYEISNHARPGEESQHNLVYWRSGLYAGVGAGAHGRMRIDGVRTAISTERQPEAWAAAVERDGHGLVERTPLSHAETADEMLIMGLRLAEGLDLVRLAQATGLAPSARALEKVEGMGLATVRPGRVAATRDGRTLLNQLVLTLSQGLEPTMHGTEANP
jgi:putative oxygen-independent coproporphyrinogen III oxidase